MLSLLIGMFGGSVLGLAGLMGIGYVGIMLRIMPLNSQFITDGSRLLDKRTTSNNSYTLVLLSYYAALASAYAFHYRKMKNPKEISKLFLQLMVIFPLILFLCEAFLREVFLREVGIDSDKTNLQLDKHDESRRTLLILISQTCP